MAYACNRRAALIIHVKENKENLHKSSRLHTWAALPTFLMLLKENGGKKKQTNNSNCFSASPVITYFLFFSFSFGEVGGGFF